IGRLKIEDLMPAGLRGDYRRGLANFLATGYGPILNHLVEQPALRRDGTEFVAELSICPLRFENAYRFNAFIADVTHRKKNQEQKQVLKDAIGRELDKIQHKTERAVSKHDVVDVITKLKAMLG